MDTLRDHGPLSNRRWDFDGDPAHHLDDNAEQSPLTLLDVFRPLAGGLGDLCDRVSWETQQDHLDRRASYYRAAVEAAGVTVRKIWPAHVGPGYDVEWLRVRAAEAKAAGSMLILPTWCRALRHDYDRGKCKVGEIPGAAKLRELWEAVGGMLIYTVADPAAPSKDGMGMLKRWGQGEDRRGGRPPREVDVEAMREYVLSSYAAGRQTGKIVERVVEIFGEKPGPSLRRKIQGWHKADLVG